MASFPGQPASAGTINTKSLCVLMNQEMMGCQWHQLDMQVICTLLQTDNYASTSSLNFTGRMIFPMPHH